MAVTSRSCAGCGKAIPPGAKLAASSVTARQLAILRDEPAGSGAGDAFDAELCLQCRIRLAEFAKGRG